MTAPAEYCFTLQVAHCVAQCSVCVPFSGNPKRVQTGEVLCMPSDSAPAALEEDMETQGEKQLRVMAQKQLKTDVTLTE